MLVEVAAFESEVIGETWQAVHRQRRESGLPHDGPPRLGYAYARAGDQPAGRPGGGSPDRAALSRSRSARRCAEAPAIAEFTRFRGPANST